nr:hypothetical protein [uncultured Lichenicoccus sp.]
MPSTVPEKHDLNPFVTLLRRDGTLAVVGALEPLARVDNQQRAMHRISIAGSIIGSIAETQEVQVQEGRERRRKVPLCHRHGVAEAGRGGRNDFT